MSTREAAAAITADSESIAQRAVEIAEELRRTLPPNTDFADGWQQRYLDRQNARFEQALELARQEAALPAPVAARGEVVVTRNAAGHIVAVTRQDEEGRILSVIAVAAQPAASGVDALWVDEDRFRHRFEHWCTGGDSRNLPAIERRSSTGAYKLMQTQSDWVAWLAAREALRAHLSTALTGAAKE